MPTAKPILVALTALLLAGCGNLDPHSHAPDCDDCNGWSVDDAPESTEAENDVETTTAALGPCEPAPRLEAPVNWGELESEEYDADRLVERVETKDTGNFEGTYRFQWKYDEAGRLIEVTTELNGEPVARSNWEYDEGRPTAVERTIGGVVVERQIWHYDGDELTDRRVEMAPRGFSRQLDNSFSWIARDTIDLHDTYSLRPNARFSGGYGDFDNPWDDANRHLAADDDADCYGLPASVGHGYPKDEASYHLGWPDGEEMNAPIGFDYGFAAYAYYYGTQAWYGHMGIATGWPFSLNFGADRSIVAIADIAYDERGRMVAEQLEVTSEQMAPETGDDWIFVERTRRFDDRGLADDRVVAETDSHTGEATLQFSRNDDGDLLFRQRFRNGELDAFQNWTYEDGRAVKLDIYIPDTPLSATTVYYVVPAVGWTKVLFEDPEAEIVHSATYDRTAESADAE